MAVAAPVAREVKSSATCFATASRSPEVGPPEAPYSRAGVRALASDSTVGGLPLAAAAATSRMCLTANSTVQATERCVFVSAIKADSAEPPARRGMSGSGMARSHRFRTAAATAGGSLAWRLSEPPPDWTREIAARTASSLTEPPRKRVGSSRAAGSRRTATHELTK
eukprot:scaffold5292_cov113-Isochrysis_galbana.AAC.14